MIDDPEDPAKFIGDLCWIGCPQCEGPVNTRPVRDQAMRAVLLRVADLIEGGKVAPADFVKRLRIIAIDLYEGMQADLAFSCYPLEMLDDFDAGEDEAEEADEPAGGSA